MTTSDKSAAIAALMAGGVLQRVSFTASTPPAYVVDISSKTLKRVTKKYAVAAETIRQSTVEAGLRALRTKVRGRRR